MFAARADTFPGTTITATDAVISGQTVNDSLRYRRLVSGLLESGRFDGALVSVELGMLLESIFSNEGTLGDDLRWFERNQARLDSPGRYVWRDRQSLELSGGGIQGGFDRHYLQTVAIRMNAFAREPSSARDLLLSLPIVTEVTERTSPDFQLATRRLLTAQVSNMAFVDLRTFTGFESQLQATFEAALLLIGETDRTAQHELIAHLPETNEGFRNRLITAAYTEYSRELQQWADGVISTEFDPILWGSVAAWASAGVGSGIRGEGISQFAEPEALQAFADGNQWIFDDALRHYARLLDFLEETGPNPTVIEFERYLSGSGEGTADFGPNDQRIQLGVAALIASRYATGTDRLRLAHISNLLFADVEQQGIQLMLETAADVPFLPDDLATIFVNILIGETEINVDQPVEDIYDFDPETGSVNYQTNNLPGDFLDLDFDCLFADPGECQDPALISNVGLDTYLDSDALNFDFFGTDSSVTLDLPILDSFPEGTHDEWGNGSYSPEVGVWRTNNILAIAPSLGSTSDASDWANWDERMWFLANLFRVVIVDQSIKGAPVDGAGLEVTFADSSQFTDLYQPESIESLSVDLFEGRRSLVNAPAIAGQ